jgi:transcriptional regulator with XRE-family HTH domain
MTENIMKISKLIKEKRESSGMSQLALAKAIGLESGVSISDFERGRKQVHPKHFPRLEKALGLERGFFYQCFEEGLTHDND